MGRCCTSLLFTAAWLLPVAAAWAASDDDVFRYRPTPTLSAAAAQGDLEALRDLLTKGEDPNAQDEQGCAPLYYACREGRLDAARLLLEAGAPVNAACGQGEFPINLAAHSGNVDLVKLLLEQGADNGQPGQFGGHPLNDAACSGSLAMVKYLLSQGAEIDAYDSYFRSALSHACLFDRPDARKYQTVVRTLLDAGANANLGAGEFDTPITYALMQANPSTLELLLNHGADPNVQNAWGLTPLHFAGKYHNRAAVPILLAHGARVEDIYQAVAADNVAIAGKLLREGVNVKVKDWQGETPLDWAVAMGSARVAALLISRPEESGVTREEAQEAVVSAAGEPDIKLVKAMVEAIDSMPNAALPAAALCAAASADSATVLLTLMNAGIDVNGRDSMGDTALHRAALGGHMDAMKLLIEKGAQVESADLDGATPLHLAAGYHQLEAVKYLLENAAPVEAKDSRGQTALHYVCASWEGAYANRGDLQEEIEIAKVLLQAGANPDVLDNTGQAPLDLTNPTNGCGTGVNFELQCYMVGQGADLSQKWLADHNISVEEYGWMKQQALKREAGD